jgi:integrase/recombinase XerD
MKTLRRHLAEYLVMRSALGFKTDRARWLLTSFVAFVEATPRALITNELALAWAKCPADAHPGWWAQKLSTVCIFARYVHLVDPRHQIPDRQLLTASTPRSTPVLYSSRDIRRILRAACNLESPFRALTYETLLGLLAATGMRVGEALRLDCEHADWKNQLLQIHASKFRKSREVVLHRTVIDALSRYAAERDRYHRKPRSNAFFLSLSGTRLIYNNVHRTFAALLSPAGVARECARLHDLRHTFAVQTILRWHREGRDVEVWMPRLSTYLGHASPASTYWYLTASPELIALVGHKLERALGALP